MTDVLQALIDARHHVDTKWVRSAWFKYVEKDSDTPETGDNVPKNAQVIGVCAAGSVLYALDYTNEQWTSKKDVRPVMEALYGALPQRSHARMRTERVIKDRQDFFEEHRANPLFTKKNLTDQIYSAKVDGVVEYNDLPSHGKQDVLNLFDKAIENVRVATFTICELEP